MQAANPCPVGDPTRRPFNTTDQPVVVEGEKGFLPAEFGLFLIQAYAFFDADPANSLPPRAISQMSLFSPRYDSWLAGPPIALQRLFFGMIAPTARLLGYRSFYEWCAEGLRRSCRPGASHNLPSVLSDHSIVFRRS
jgi:hypothetical protein